ncbi:Z-ring formation inhibitor MciZ [Thermobacillus sp. ZCTH02-B1]|nr:Z-ring formation inhibitor MciZ [Thermobacillus sp. ZCTH02-B1]
MKQYNDPNGIRLVGKAWEIRHRLRVLADGRKKLADYVRRHGARTGGK